MRVRVLLHIRFLMESFTTILTRIRSRVTMDEQMRAQSGRTFEHFTAFVTLEMSIRRAVNGLVLIEAHRVAKRFLTQMTLKRSFTPVRPNQHDEERRSNRAGECEGSIMIFFYRNRQIMRLVDEPNDRPGGGGEKVERVRFSPKVKRLQVK